MADEKGRLRAAAHPVRLRILSLLTGVDLSATDVARELGIAHASASYHLRVLADAGLIVIAGEERVRGGLVKRYSYPRDGSTDDVGRPQPDPEGRQLYFQATADELLRRGRQVREGGKGYSVDAELWVTPETWEQVRAHLASAGRLVHAEALPARTPGALHVNLTTAAFEMRDEERG